MDERRNIFRNQKEVRLPSTQAHWPYAMQTMQNSDQRKQNWGNLRKETYKPFKIKWQKVLEEQFRGGMVSAKRWWRIQAHSIRVMRSQRPAHNWIQAGSGNSKKDYERGGKEHIVTQLKALHLEGTYGGTVKKRKVSEGSEAIQSEQMIIKLQCP